MGVYVPILAFWPYSPLFVCSKAEVLKIVSLCFGPELMLIKGLKALDCLHAKAESPNPLGTRDRNFEVNAFGTTNPLFGNNT